MTSDPADLSPSHELTRARFVVRYGVLGWGVTTAILFTIVNAIDQGWDDFFLHLVPALIVFPLGGVLFGRIMWGFKQRQLAKQRKILACVCEESPEGGKR